ncbi:MAG: citramalate synthase [Spirochaetaceae bacterium]|nr:citramalate synthase [Spirochaetaceae bacterium]
MKKVSLFDSTLRDGAQGQGINFSLQDKLHIVQALDELGVDYIEAGNPGANPKDLAFFNEIKNYPLTHAKLAAFGATRRKDISCENDENLQSLVNAGTEVVVIFGKSWDFQVTKILKTTLEENLAMIFDSVAFAVSQGKKVIFDAEHFFDGFAHNKAYALLTLRTALEAGAFSLCLCDTIGATLPTDIFSVVQLVKEQFPHTEIGIHAHNDGGMAVANSIMAVSAGATQIQGTLLGFGERTGNAHLATIIGNLETKMQCSCLPAGNLEKLTAISRRIAEITNIKIGEGEPYIGINAFAHKAGMHIDAVAKNPQAYEHISPERVGNERIFLMSEVAGRAMIIEKIRKFDESFSKDNPLVSDIMKKVKDLELNGFQFEGADASFELLVRKILGTYKPFFKLHYYKVIGELPKVDIRNCSFAQLKIEVDSKEELSAGEGDGPVHALDIALRKALIRFYPIVSSIRLIDYKVRVIDTTTASKVRVLIETSDGKNTWTTVGVSSDIVEASWMALVDSFEYKLLMI